MEKALKIIVAFLLICTMFSLSFDLHQFVSLIAVVLLAILSYNSYVYKRPIEVITYLVFIVIFQPLYVFTLPAIVWNVIVVFVAFYLIGSCFYGSKKRENSQLKEENY